MYDLPLIAPSPPRLSELTEALREMEERRIFSNGGPLVRRFEADITAKLFGGHGDSLAVSSATLGLVIALKHAAGQRPQTGGLAIMPAMTFAATAQAALWAGLTPLICDIEPDSWVASAAAEEALLKRFGRRIAAIVPYATFGRTLDLDRYRALSQRYQVPVVIDAAASLGSTTEDGLNFGADAPFAIVYSMHATKTFATAEGGLVHSGDTDLIADLRKMTNFGFGGERRAELPGLNAKLSEIGGLLALTRLADFEDICAHRARLGAVYAERLAGFAGQAPMVGRQTYQFWSMLLPLELAPRRADIVRRLAGEGIGTAHYFSPHLGEQPFIREHSLCEPTPVSDDVSARILSLPITDRMSVADVAIVCDRLLAATEHTAIGSAVPQVGRRLGAAPCNTVMIGGGPAGTAVLTALSKHGKLTALAQRGLTIVEQGDRLGKGRLGTYAIRSDSTAETFLTAVKDNPHPEIAALAGHPAALAVGRYIGALGAPLVEAGPFVEVTGNRLGRIAAAHGANLLTGHTAVSSHRLAGDKWRTVLRGPDGASQEVVSRNIVIATGGYQCPERVRGLHVAGAALAETAGERLMLADEFLKIGGVAALRERLAGSRAPRIVIIGGSTSALAAATLLLNATPALPLGAGGITVLHREQLRPFYPSRQAALDDGFDDFTDDDICPVSGFVYRLAGFRLEARELVLRMLGIGGRTPEPRVALHRLSAEGDTAARAVITSADVVIAATGYRPNALPLFDLSGARITLASEAEQPAPMVDRHCRIVDAAGHVVRGAYGIGLAAGFVPWGALGGEPSFRGNANGLWLWQNDVGRMIGEALLAPRKEADAAVA